MYLEIFFLKTKTKNPCVQKNLHTIKNTFAFILCMYIGKIMHAKYFNNLNYL